ncbi:hypothetical protein [Parafilimonas terrae]|uniref:DUF4149 domain-containing protein n=1 Tax=Parafilimonas terrae TaxID=1465490 RepID=A0A1I5TTA1_9BACT|nr:hypothetical protein [Parafilimonas terrae]SFP86253.1 hypothetical protein SAMN05444277_102292 [Parafilimonas terrae]
MATVKLPVAIVITFVWIGFVCAISFMESWIKFRAPNVTLSVGLGIGRIVFKALNRVEILLSVIIFINLLLSGNQLLTLRNLTFFIPLLVVLMQAFWLLPALDARAELRMQNAVLPPSNLHFYYIGTEVLKVACLFIFGTSLFK